MDRRMNVMRSNYFKSSLRVAVAFVLVWGTSNIGSAKENFSNSVSFKSICEGQAVNLNRVTVDENIVYQALRQDNPDFSRLPCSELDSYVSAIPELNLARKGISGVGWLIRFGNLRKLNLAENKISSVKNMPVLSQLEDVDIGWNRLDNVDNILSQPKLKQFLASDNEIKEVNIEMGGEFLENIVLSLNPISKFTVKKILASLKELDIGESPPTDGFHSGLVYKFSVFFGICRLELSNVQFLKLMPNLEKLRIGYASLKDIESVSELNSLKDLNFNLNHISNIAPLAKLNRLITLRLAKNRIEDISALAGLQNLKKLNISDNKIRDFLPLESLYNLEELMPYGNNHNTGAFKCPCTNKLKCKCSY